MLQEFKEFALKGNVLDLAVGVIIGGAFGTIVNSVVNDLVMPLVAAVIGKPDFSDIYIKLGDLPADYAGTMSYADVSKAVPTIGLGAFLTVLINFLILAWIIFLIVRSANRMRKQEAAAPAAPPPPPEDVVLLREIRDALKK